MLVMIDGSFITNSHRPIRRNSTVKLRRVGVKRCEHNNHVKYVQTPAYCRRFNSHRRQTTDGLSCVGRCELTISYTTVSTRLLENSVNLHCRIAEGHIAAAAATAER